MPKRILPLIPPGLSVVQVLPTPDRVTIVAEPSSPTGTCPDCGTPSRTVHSRYDRHLGDLPWQGRPVALRIKARRFRCHVSVCTRRTFSERLAGVAAVAARRTERLGSLHVCLGLALGGEAGARLAARLAINTSPDTLLRAVRSGNGDAPGSPAPRVLGVDDWAWRRGHRYGTVLVDLERNRVVELLPDRQAESLAAWLKQHPGVEIIARDRAGAYADGARQGAPDAVQVTDRWHLLRNLGDAAHALAERHGSAVRRVAAGMTDEHAAAVAAAPTVPPAPRPPNAATRASQASRARRQARYEEAARLHRGGASILRIAALLGTERKTVRRWLRLGQAPSWEKPRRGSGLDPYVPLLKQRWAEGCRNAAQLWREVSAAGYAGRPSTVRAWATRWRDGQAAPQARHDTAPITPAAWQPPSGRRVARLLMADTEVLGTDERRFVARLFADVPEMADAIAVAKRLRQVLRKQSDEPLKDVLAAAESTLLADFVASLRRDLDAVQAALNTPWTTSPAEGQVNRIKTIKRSMYGRAGFDLLRARVLHAA